MRNPHRPPQRGKGESVKSPETPVPSPPSELRHAQRHRLWLPHFIWSRSWLTYAALIDLRQQFKQLGHLFDGRSVGICQARCNGSSYKHGKHLGKHGHVDGSERKLGALPDRRHRPMPALSPPASASPKRHGVELGHHNCASGSRAVDPRARPPCSSTLRGLRKERARLMRAKVRNA